MSTRTMIATAVLLGLAVPAGAQQHRHGQTEGQEPGTMMSCPMMQQMMQGMHGRMEGMGMDMQGMDGPMMGSGMMTTMGGMHGGPGMILQSAGDLRLSPDQTRRLEALQDEVRSGHQEHMQAAMAAHRQAAAALEGDAPDLDAYRSALDEAADHMVSAHVMMTRAGLDARGVLTPEQREKLRSTMGGMHGMHGGAAHGGQGGSGHAGHR